MGAKGTYLSISVHSPDILYLKLPPRRLCGLEVSLDNAKFVPTFIQMRQFGLE